MKKNKYLFFIINFSFIVIALFIVKTKIYVDNDCVLGNVIVEHNQSALFYNTDWAQKNTSCESVSRNCVDGALNGNNNFKEISCKEAGMSVGIYAYSRGQEPTVEEEKYIDTVYVRYNPYFGRNIGESDEVFNDSVEKLINTIVTKVKVLENKNIDTILDFQFIENESGLSFHSVDEVINLLDRLLLKLNEYELPLKSITLGEENIWHYPSVSSYSSSNKKSREDYFNEIYTILKVKYPNQSFLQWYSPVSHDKQRAPGYTYNIDKIVPIFEADGLVIDQYKYDREYYELYVNEAKKYYTDLYSIVWASPNWDISINSEKQFASSSWWNEIRWKNFYDKIAINQQNNIDTSFFMYGLNSDKKAAFLGGNKVGFECGGKFYEDFMKITIPYISTNQIDLNNRPDSKPFWIPTYNSDC